MQSRNKIEALYFVPVICLSMKVSCNINYSSGLPPNPTQNSIFPEWCNTWPDSQVHNGNSKALGEKRHFHIEQFDVLTQLCVANTL